MYSTSRCRDLCGSIIKQPASTSKSLRAGGIHGGYVIPNQSGAITHMVVEKDEKQLLTAGYLLGLDSLETTHSYVNVKTKKGQMGQSVSSSDRAKEVSRVKTHKTEKRYFGVRSFWECTLSTHHLNYKFDSSPPSCCLPSTII